MSKGTLTISSARVHDEGDRTVQEADITISLKNKEGGKDIETHTLIYSVPIKYGYGLCTDLSDAYVIAFLNHCMRKDLDIVAESPISSHLYHNITEYIIPALVHEDRHFKTIKINAPIMEDSQIRSGEHVGTGMSCGVDSLHSLWHYLNYEDSSRRLTHLCITDVGAFNACYGSEKRIEIVKQTAYERARTASKSVGLPLIEIECNITHVLPQNHKFTHTFTDLFSIMMMRYFWKIYYYGSAGNGRLALELEGSCTQYSGHYDMFTLPLVSDGKLDIFSEGFLSNRYQKLKDIKDAPFAHKYLYSCTKSKNNCGCCNKCLRNLWNLDALGCLDSFRESFDIDAYRKKRKEYMVKLVSTVGSRKLFLEDASRIFSENKDPDYLYALDEVKKIDAAVSDYQEGRNLKDCYKIFEKNRHYSILARIYYAKAKIEGKGTDADEELGNRILRTTEVRSFLRENRSELKSV
jgi:hypothetical protein